MGYYTGFLALVVCFYSHAQIICTGKVSLLTENANCGYGTLMPVLIDEFSGNELDTSVWKKAIGVVRDTGRTAYWLFPENVVVSDGTLKLRYKRDTLSYYCFETWDTGQPERHCRDFYFSAGEIVTKRNYGFGLYEIRCRMPKGRGLSCAFWMYTRKDQNEIDVFEYGNEYNVLKKFDLKKQSRSMNMNTRTDYEDDLSIEDCPNHVNTHLDQSADFHVYTLHYTPHKIEWFFDGKLMCSTFLFHNLMGQPIDCNGIFENDLLLRNRAFPRHAMEIFVSVGIDPEEINQDEDPLPNVWEVDYIKFYRYSGL